MKSHTCLRMAFWAILSSVMCSCTSPTTTNEEYALRGDTLTLYSHLLTIVDLPDGTSLVEIANPWDKGQTSLAKFITIPEGIEIDTLSLTSGIPIVRTPITRAAVFSGVHTSALNELGSLDALVAVADGDFFSSTDTIVQMLRARRLTDVGASASPSVERLIAVTPQAVLLSPMQDTQMPNLPENIALIPMADYMETTPLGRAEWILLLGKLFGQNERAARIFSNVVERYSDLRAKVELTSSRPMVLTDTEYQGVWYVPGGGSYMARMIRDAGARTPWAEDTSTGSLSIPMERIIAEASDADFWVIRSFGATPTLASLKRDNPRHSYLKPWKERKVYVCDTQTKPLFNDIAFHPERILAEYISIFHPEIEGIEAPGYFIQAQ